MAYNIQPCNLQLGDLVARKESLLSEIHDLQEELDAIEDFLDDFDLRYQDELIHEDNFAEHIKEQFEDCYSIPCVLDEYVDWDAIAETARVDYTAYEWDGETYYVRDC